MFTILVSDPLAEAGVALLRRGATVDVRTGLPPAELAALLPGYDALIVRSETQVTADLPRLARVLEPRAILLDLRLPGSDGVAALAENEEPTGRHGTGRHARDE